MESIDQAVIFEQIIQKSRFLCYLTPLRSEKDFDAQLETIRREHPQATHHCYAVVRGDFGQFVQSSDDKEPHGTAGAPMLSVLQGARLTDVSAVVVRYFGGTLLGTGGLVRAYSSSVAEALKKIVRVNPTCVVDLEIQAAFHDAGKLEGWLRSHALAFSSDYGEDVVFRLRAQRSQFEELNSYVLMQSKDRATIRIVNETAIYL